MARSAKQPNGQRMTNISADSRWWLRQPNDEIERWVLVVNGNKREKVVVREGSKRTN